MTEVKKPREFWIIEDEVTGYIVTVLDEKPKVFRRNERAIHVKEVIEGEKDWPELYETLCKSYGAETRRLTALCEELVLLLKKIDSNPERMLETEEMNILEKCEREIK